MALSDIIVCISPTSCHLQEGFYGGVPCKVIVCSFKSEELFLSI